MVRAAHRGFLVIEKDFAEECSDTALCNPRAKEGHKQPGHYLNLKV